MRDRAETGGSERMTEDVKTDVVKQVAEAKCPYTVHYACCQGTGLRWPPLSRVPELEVTAGGNIAGSVDVQVGRVPDVSEGKLLDIYLRKHGEIHLVWDEQVGVYSIDPGDQILNFVGKTIMETLAAALLATVED